MNDSNFYKIDTQLYDLLNKHFKLDLTKPENLKAYFNFRNETINFIDELNRKNKTWKTLLILIILEIGFWILSIKTIFQSLKHITGPVMIVVQITKSDNISPRVEPTPIEIRNRFMMSLKR